MTLGELQVGQSAIINKVGGEGALRHIRKKKLYKRCSLCDGDCSLCDIKNN